MSSSFSFRSFLLISSLFLVLSIVLQSSLVASSACKGKGSSTHSLNSISSHKHKFIKHSKSTLIKKAVHQKNLAHHKHTAANNNNNNNNPGTYTQSKTNNRSTVSASKPVKSWHNSSAQQKSSHTDSIASLLSVSSSCGAPDPSSTITSDSGPNGRQEFFNCGITGQGWVPAKVKMSMIKTVSLESDAAQSTFAPCQPYNELFEKYGAKYNIPPIFLASFAMQESSCHADTRGDNGGAFGLMQITQDKCGQAPGGNCADPDYNVMMGAQTFANGLSSSDGNVLVALGAYNGWQKGLTKDQALAAKDKGCCECQQNLDYLQQFLNGWVLGVNPYTRHLGVMRNLDVCGTGN